MDLADGDVGGKKLRTETGGTMKANGWRERGRSSKGLFQNHKKTGECKNPLIKGKGR